MELTNLLHLVDEEVRIRTSWAIGRRETLFCNAPIDESVSHNTLYSNSLNPRKTDQTKNQKNK